MAGTLRLTVEEVALALAQLGRADLGHGLMVAQLGSQISEEESSGRLLSAGHSLMLRGLLTIESDGTMMLATPVVRVAEILTGADFTIRFTQSTPQSDRSFSYHFKDNNIYEHFIDLGVIHVITDHEQPRATVDGGVNFFEIAGLQTSLGTQGEMSQALLEQVQNGLDLAKISQLLEKASLTSQLRQQLAEDFAYTAYRGSVLRVEYGANGEPTADRGLLILRGAERFWLFKPIQRPSGAVVTVIPGSEAVFRREVAALLK